MWPASRGKLSMADAESGAQFIQTFDAHTILVQHDFSFSFCSKSIAGLLGIVSQQQTVTP